MMRAREHEHVERVEAASVSALIAAPPWRNCARNGPMNGAVALMLIPTVVAQYAVWSHGSR